MLNLFLNRNSALACLADCPADNHARPARTVFIRDVVYNCLSPKGFFLKAWAVCLFGPGMGRIRTYLLVASPSIVAMRSWRVFWDFPNVITLHILEVKVVEKIDIVNRSTALI